MAYVYNCRLSNCHLFGGKSLLLDFTGSCAKYDLVMGEDNTKLALGEGFRYV